MEKVTGGELFDRIVVEDHFSEAEAANVFVQVRTLQWACACEGEIGSGCL